MTHSLPDTIAIHGGQPLKGEILVHGAKNALSKEMVAALLTDEACTLHNVAKIRDVTLVSEIIREMGGRVDETSANTLTIQTEALSMLSPDEMARFSGKSRIPILLCGPLLHRHGKVVIPRLGGDIIGPRPVDFHLSALQQMGATLSEEGQFLILEATSLHGIKLRLPYPSVGATEQILYAASLADGITELDNAAMEPEILDLIQVLQKMGAIISVDTDRVITIVGVKKLHGYTHTTLTDRLEAVSWACAAIATHGYIFVRNARQIDLMTFLNKFRQIGGGFEVRDDGIAFWREHEDIQPIALQTDVYPGFSTDYQQPFVVALTQAQGVSVVHETVYEDRFGYAETLNSMGAQIQLYKDCLGSHDCRFGAKNYMHSAVITGPTPLHAADIMVPDIRAGFSYVVAALMAKGVSNVTNFSLLERGYEHFLDRLEGIGAQIDH